MAQITNVLAVKDKANLRELVIIAASTAIRRPTAGNLRRTKIKDHKDIKGSRRGVLWRPKVKGVGQGNFC